MANPSEIIHTSIPKDELDAMKNALRRCNEFFARTLPKCNLMSSALDANDWRLINEVPTEVRRVLVKPIPACTDLGRDRR